MSSRIVTFFLLLSLTILSGCGGRPAAPHILTAADIFSNKAETWTFQNGWGDITTIEVSPVDANHSIWHYTKTAARAYWQPGVEQAEDWFDLERDAQGNWYSTGGVENMPLGAFGSAPVLNLRYSVTTKPGQQRPYLILPSVADFSYQTLFDDTVPGNDGTLVTLPNLTWKTSSYMAFVQTPAYTGMAYVSDQWEGSCVHEIWWFAPNLGLVKVAPMYCGGPAADPNATMVRIH